MGQHDDSSVFSERCGANGALAESPDFLQAHRIKRALLEEQRSRWAEGEQVPAEEVLSRWPSPPDKDPFAVTVLYEDFMQRRQLDNELSLQEYSRQFPSHEAELSKLASFDKLMNALVKANGGQVRRRTRGSLLGLPDVGDEVFGFRLCAELGRGAFARVFLAEQSELAGRPVVLKLSAIEGTEPQTLAQLQHTHIVPIHSVHEDPQAGLRAVCMPWFGGASLSQVLHSAWEVTSQPTQGRELVDALNRVQPKVSTAGRGLVTITTSSAVVPSDNADGSRSPLHELADLNYVQAVAWIVLRLAQGLEHAHNRGVLHRDVKPSNVLLSGDGQPLLLDFNLSHDQLDDAAEATVGGTVAYMAPEHLRALIGRKAALVKLVDRRSDIYSLGMVLFEMLTGNRPFDQSGSYSARQVQIEAMAEERSKAVPSLKARRIDVPWSMESIVRKCLAPEPAQRYPRAEHLAEDLRRFLDDRPLKFAPELSWVERGQKWARRHPRLTYSAGVTSVAAVALLSVGSALNSVRGSLLKTQEQLQTVQARDRRAEYEAGTVRALCLVNTAVPLQDHLREGIEVCERTLSLYDLLSGIRWREPTEWSQVAREDRRRLAEDARELFLLLAAARSQVSSDSSTLQGCLTLLDRAESVPGLSPSKALWLDRAQYLRRLGKHDLAQKAEAQATQLTAESSREHYLLATAYARSGSRDGVRRALTELDAAIRLEPRHYWSWVQRGFCHFELGEHVLAAADFGHCTGLWPEFAWGYFNRGRVFDETGMKSDAIRDYTTAIERDPEFSAAFVNRGLALLELGRHADALADFDRATKLGKSDATLLASRGMALEAFGRHTEADLAFQKAFSQAVGQSAAVRTRLLWAYGFAVSARLPQEAQNAFSEVLSDEPDNPQALYGLAMLAMNRNDHESAADYFDRALDAHPEFVEARRYRAILLARLGLLDRASQDINRCLEKEPNVGATLYAAACVASRAAERIADPQVRQQALDLLRRAFAQGTGTDKAKTDPDLAEIRRHPQFPNLFSPSGSPL